MVSCGSYQHKTDVEKTYYVYHLAQQLMMKAVLLVVEKKQLSHIHGPFKSKIGNTTCQRAGHLLCCTDGMAEAGFSVTVCLEPQITCDWLFFMCTSQWLCLVVVPTFIHKRSHKRNLAPYVFLQGV